MSLRSIYITLASSIIFLCACGALAESNNDQDLCKGGQFILQVSSINIKAQRELENADKVLSEDISVIDSVGSTILIEDDSNTTTPESRHDAERLCRELRAKKREAIKIAREENRVPLRLPDTCDCNGVVDLQQSAVQSSNDPYLSLLWGMANSTAGGANAVSAWSTTTGSRNPVVAIVDTGIDYTHQDLASNMWTNPGEIAGNGIDDDNDGYIDDIHGINSIFEKSDVRAGNPFDDNGHGTHCAGTIGGVGNNSLGVAGVNWRTSLVAAKFLSAQGGGSIFDAIESLNYVADLKEKKGVNIVVANNSWGGGGFYSPVLTAIRRLDSLGIVFVAAAGNNNVNNDSTESYPANYDSPNVISVAAHDTNGNKASFSNYGVNSVDISAPGVNIASCAPGNQYVYMSGTSMAAPHVSGAVALLSAYRPGLNVTQLISTILNSSNVLTSLSGVVQGGRALNISNALVNSPIGAPTITPRPSPTSTPTPLPTATATPTSTPTPTATPTPIAPFANISGIVVDENGVQISGARVSVKNSLTNEEFIRNTNSDGAYVFYDLATNTNYVVSVSVSGRTFQPTQYSLTLKGNVSVNFISAELNYVISVQILSRTKRPLPNISVNAGILGILNTDASGVVRFNAPYGSSYDISVDDASTPFLISDLHGVVYGDVERTFVSLAE